MIMKWSWEWFLNWNFAFIGVACIPILGACYSFELPGFIGFAVAVMILWFVGVLIHQFPGRFRCAFNTGVWFLSLTQVLPILQFIAVYLAIRSYDWLSGQTFATANLFTAKINDSFLSCFVVTIVSGQILGLEALIVGYVTARLFQLFDPDEQVSIETSPAKQADLADSRDIF